MADPNARPLLIGLGYSPWTRRAVWADARSASDRDAIIEQRPRGR